MCYTVKGSKSFTSPCTGGIVVLASAEVQQHLASALLRFLLSKFIALVPSVWIFCSSKQWGQSAGALLITICDSKRGDISQCSFKKHL